MSENMRRPTVFAILPPGKEFDEVYRDGVKAACRDAGADCTRVAAKTFTGNVLRRIHNSVRKADLVVADLTGNDPSVFHELGYAFSLNKRVVMLARDSTEVPFDMREHRLIVYDGDIQQLRLGLHATLESSMKVPRPQVEPIPVDRPVGPSEDSRAVDPSESAGVLKTAGQIFISYSHKDRFWLEQLKTMYSPLVWRDEASVWDDTLIPPGQLWEKTISDAVAGAKVAVLLVSPDFIASEFIRTKEMPWVMNAVRQNRLVPLWILVDTAYYETLGLELYQAAHDIKRPLVKVTRKNRNTVLRQICDNISKALGIDLRPK